MNARESKDVRGGEEVTNCTCRLRGKGSKSMNLLGKALVVAILVMSVVFMSLAMAVYSTHQNWYEEAERLQGELTTLTAERDRNVAEHNRLESQLRGEIE